MRKFAVINNFAGNEDLGYRCLSTHATQEAAEKAAAKYQAEVKRANGSSSYLPLSVVLLENPKKGEYYRSDEVLA